MKEWSRGGGESGKERAGVAEGSVCRFVEKNVEIDEVTQRWFSRVSVVSSTILSYLTRKS